MDELREAIDKGFIPDDLLPEANELLVEPAYQSLGALPALIHQVSRQEIVFIDTGSASPWPAVAHGRQRRIARSGELALKPQGTESALETSEYGEGVLPPAPGTFASLVRLSFQSTMKRLRARARTVPNSSQSGGTLTSDVARSRKGKPV